MFRGSLGCWIAGCLGRECAVFFSKEGFRGDGECESVAGSYEGGFRGTKISDAGILARVERSGIMVR